MPNTENNYERQKKGIPLLGYPSEFEDYEHLQCRSIGFTWQSTNDKMIPTGQSHWNETNCRTVFTEAFSEKKGIHLVGGYPEDNFEEYEHLTIMQAG